MAESDKKIVKIIHESGKRVYSTFDEDVAETIMSLEVYKHGLVLIGVGAFGWVFEAENQVIATNLEQRIKIANGIEVVISDLRPKRG